MAEENRPFTALPAKRATIKDVARAAKVSPMTVSNVLNNKDQLVGSKTKMRVDREVLRLNYRRPPPPLYPQYLEALTKVKVLMISAKAVWYARGFHAAFAVEG